MRISHINKIGDNVKYIEFETFDGRYIGLNVVEGDRFQIFEGEIILARKFNLRDFSSNSITEEIFLEGFKR